MLIAGVVPFSLIEYPGKISCVVFTLGCNLKCGYCHNKEFVLPQYHAQMRKTIIPEAIFFHFLEKRKASIEAVSICGGEPTLQKDLENFCLKVKGMGLSVKLDTNGTSPKVLLSLLEKELVDYISMDVKYTFPDYERVSGKIFDTKKYTESIEIICARAKEYEFRTTCISPYHTIEVIQQIGGYLQNAKKWYLQKFRFGENLDEDFPGISFTQQEMLYLLSEAKKYVVSAEIRV